MARLIAEAALESCIGFFLFHHQKILFYIKIVVVYLSAYFGQITLDKSAVHLGLLNI